MRLIIIILILLFSIDSFGQLNLNEQERNELKDICSEYTLAKGVKGLRERKKTSSAKFHDFIDQLVASKDDSDEILKDKYLKRPTDEELAYWYVIREFHYNNNKPDSLKKTNEQILDWLTKERVDDRWLLDNYFYRIGSRIATLYNKEDFSKMNFELENLGLRNETEKAMFVMFMSTMCGQRLSVMNFTGRGDPESVIKRFPKFNGKDYYYYTNFNYPDFEWIGYDKTESYNGVHIGGFYEVLLNHLDFLVKKGQKDRAFELCKNSILNEPSLFKYSKSQKLLGDIYENSK